MAKAILIYGTDTGNTEILSEPIVEGLKAGGIEVTVKDVENASVNELANYDLIVLGCPSYGGEEDAEDIDNLLEGFHDFYNEMENISLNEKKSAVFGPGDSEEYPDTFCKAVDMLEERLKKCGAEVIVDGFRVDGDVDAAIGDAESWGSDVAQNI
jgi:flavodoxin short chain